MSMKLPIILSAMIAALAVPNVLASQAGSEPAADTTAAPDTAAAETAATPAPEAADPKAKKHAKKRKGHGKKHHKGHHADSSSNLPPEQYKGAWNEDMAGADGDRNRDLSSKAGVPVQPGQKTH